VKENNHQKKLIREKAKAKAKRRLQKDLGWRHKRPTSKTVGKAKETKLEA